MRVLHVTPYFAPAFCYGGPPRSVFALCSHLQRQGVEVEVVTTAANGADDLPASPSSGETYEGVRVRYLRRCFPRRFFGAADLRTALHATLDRSDLVHIHGLWNIPVHAAATAARRRGVPYVISPRGMLQPTNLARGRIRKAAAFRLFERTNLAGASLLHATSPEEADGLERLGLGVPVAMVPNGVDEPEAVSAVASFRRTHNLPVEAPLIVALGRIHPVKRLDLLFAAFARMLPASPEARLVIAGPDEGGHAAELRRRCGPEGRKMIWTGHLAPREKWGLLAEASVVAMCSDSESFGLSLAEAMSAAVPVVVTKTCPWEDVERFGAGLRVDQNVEAIATALLTMVSDRDASREMGRRGRDLVRSRYAWNSIAETMAAHYAEVFSTQDRRLRTPRPVSSEAR